ncbi:MAG: tRNA uridine-5-carboxymethylaminomethyl(34) synthesis enzyme MnmG [Alphaproteobacteria bacterium]|nr:tRNA uridine-5-carboxymethylaminomethyl(34) synthesis enzyme MnmG [Alphaproteobacteria bacterium]
MKHNIEIYDVVVVGAGHAGCEASTSSARCGAKTLMITSSIDDIGVLSCNPSMGGIGKSHLLAEIDACDGISAKIADMSAIHSRRLNTRKGLAVQAVRLQLDRNLYRKNMKLEIQNTENLTVIYSKLQNIKRQKDDEKTDGFNWVVSLKNKQEVFCKAVIITVGTFSNGVIYQGEEKIEAGRFLENGSPQENSKSISSILKDMDFKLRRFKTGTPPRLYKNSIDFSKLESQKSDVDFPRLSTFSSPHTGPVENCFITHTTEELNNIIQNNIDKAPMYNGTIKSIGARYCPSIEDKVMKFPHNKSHHIFLEPEGINSNLIYPNGLSTSFSPKIQLQYLRSIPGLENVKVDQFGYAIEYDVIDPTRLNNILEDRIYKNLFFAGQINGTSGYEEASAQGLVAGINAVKKCGKRPSFVFERTNSFIGVLVDDLISIGVDEPYRMFTARSEHRLTLRPDNAVDRLSDICPSVSLDRKFYSDMKHKQLGLIKAILDKKVSKEEVLNQKYDGQERKSIRKWIQSGTFNWNHFLELSKFPPEIQFTANVETLYEGYIKRQELDKILLKKQNNTRIDNVDFSKIKGLSNEVQQRLIKYKPKNLYQMSKLSGITPVAVMIVLKASRVDSSIKVDLIL